MLHSAPLKTSLPGGCMYQQVIIYVKAKYKTRKNKTACLTQYLRGSRMAADIVVSQAGLTINRRITLAFHWSIASMLSFLLHTKLPKGRRCAADMYLDTYERVFIFLFLCFFSSFSFPPCVCVSSFQISVPLRAYTGSVSFSGSTGGGDLSTPPLSTGK